MRNLPRNPFRHFFGTLLWWRGGPPEPGWGLESHDPVSKIDDRAIPLDGPPVAPLTGSHLVFGILTQFLANVPHFVELAPQHIGIFLLGVAIVTNHPMDCGSAGRSDLDVPPREAPVLACQALLSMLPTFPNGTATAETGLRSIGQGPNIDLTTPVPTSQIH